MAQTLGMDGLYRARLKVAAGKETIENIRARAPEKEPQIEAAANEFDAAFKDLLEYIDAVDGILHSLPRRGVFLGEYSAGNSSSP
jgi:hypothetical protein